MNIFPVSFQSLEQAMSATTMKQRVRAANIANVDTPGYKSKQVNFQSMLNTAIDQPSLSSIKTAPQHIAFSTEKGNSPSGFTITENNSTKIMPNGNNVDMDVEMAELAKDQLMFNALTERVNGKFTALRTVIEGR